MRLRPAPDWSRRMESIEELSRDVRARGAEYFASEAPAPADLFERFRAYFTAQLERDPERRAEHQPVHLVDGHRRARRRLGDRLPPRRRLGAARRAGRLEPAHHHSRQAGVQGRQRSRAIWDDIILSFRVRLARRPDRYMKEFWTWFCKL